MTFYPVLEGDARKAYEDSIGVCWAEAQRQLSLNEEALVLRDLLASEDLKLGTESWILPSVTASGYTTWINATVDDTRFTAIYGFAPCAYGQVTNATIGLGAGNLACVTLLRITRGGKQLRIWQIEPYTKNGVVTPLATASAAVSTGMTAPQLFTYYADDPVTVFQDIPFKVEIFTPSTTILPYGTTSATPVLALLGKVAEPEGKTINR